MLSDYQIDQAMLREDKQMADLTKIVGNSNKKQNLKRLNSVYIDLLADLEESKEKSSSSTSGYRSAQSDHGFND